MSHSPLPIDPFLPEIARISREEKRLVLVAEPGAGKTTRVPRALLDAGLAKGGEIVVLEPRRLAARMSAARVAEELGEDVGGTVGYQVRFDDRSSSKTRVRFVTEGVLTRKLTSDPLLRSASVIVFDEFHERSLDVDLALALTREACKTRSDLTMVVMSATLEAEKVAAYLGARAMNIPGRTFPIEIEHAEKPDTRRLEDRVASALQRLVNRGLDGDVLVFLPGAAEIRRAQTTCGPIAQRAGLDVEMLHGDLPPAEQDRAVRIGQRRKVVLSTNIAETSLTLPGVVAVIDSGLARIAKHSPFSGLPTLDVAAISQASATQRAGRAGRVRAGLCIRLYTKPEFDARAPHDTPEIRRADLAGAVLALRSAGHDPRTFPFFEAPPSAALDAADALLDRLGALETLGTEFGLSGNSHVDSGTEFGLSGNSRVTTLGQRMLALPLHPRLARLVIECETRGIASYGCLAAAVLSERELRLAARGGVQRGAIDTVGGSDVIARIEAFEAVEREGLRADRIRAYELDAGAVFGIDRVRKQLERAMKARGDELGAREANEALEKALLVAFPDRVARRRSEKSRDFVSSGGGAFELAESSVVKGAALVVALEAEERKGQRLVRVASEIEPEWLLEMFESRIVEVDELVFDAGKKRVERLRGLAYDGLVLDESRDASPRGADVARKLAEVALSQGIVARSDALALIERRLEVAAKNDTTFPVLDDALRRAALEAACEGKNSLAELDEHEITAHLRATIGESVLAKLDRFAPVSVSIPGRPTVDVKYEKDRDPYIESRMQDFFGAKDGPKVAGKPLVLHLLAPNGRAQQVTTDLAGFWQKHYPAIRKELMRRYPRHYWPDDPTIAEPRKPTPRKR